MTIIGKYAWTRVEFGKCVFERAEWNIFNHLSDDNMSMIDTGVNIDHVNSLISSLLMWQKKTILQSKGRIKRKMVP